MISFNVHAFDVEYSFMCAYDHLGYRPVGIYFKFCGSQLPDIPVSIGNRAFMAFVTDSHVQRSGFLISYSAVDLILEGMLIHPDDVSQDGMNSQNVTLNIPTGMQVMLRPYSTFWAVIYMCVWLRSRSHGFQNYTQAIRS